MYDDLTLSDGNDGCRYRDAPEPKLGSHSVTIRPNAEDMQKLYTDAENTWTPAFVKLIKVSLVYTCPLRPIDDAQCCYCRCMHMTPGFVVNCLISVMCPSQAVIASGDVF